MYLCIHILHTHTFVDEFIHIHIDAYTYTYTYMRIIFFSFSGDAGEMYVRYTDSVSAVNAHGSLQNMHNWSTSHTQRYAKCHSFVAFFVGTLSSSANLHPHVAICAIVLGGLEQVGFLTLGYILHFNYLLHPSIDYGSGNSGLNV